MNNEIKEILDKLKELCYDDYCLEFSVDYIERKEEKLLLDYITNLEECHENMFYINLENDKLIWDLENENEKLKDTLNKIMVSDGETTTPILDLIKEKEDYKSRNEKAVEYMETRIDSSKAGKWELLNILNGKE